MPSKNSTWWFAACIFLRAPLFAAIVPTLPGTEPLSVQGDLSEQMVNGIHKYLDRESTNSVAGRAALWHRDFSSAAAYEASVASNRAHLRRIIGAVDRRLAVKALDLVASTEAPAELAQTDAFVVIAVRWPVFEGVSAEGLWLRPKARPVARVVALPDADQTPEMVAGLVPGLAQDRQFARRLAENGCEVLVPVLIDRQDTFSGSARLNRLTNQPHREWIYRQAFEMGRHVIGYEVQEVFAAIDFFGQVEDRDAASRAPVGVVGYGEGGLLAFYSAALDTRIETVLVSGYFDARERLWTEPIYRNLFGLLREFGDAEIATLIAPRALVVEYSAVPKITGPPPARPGRAGAAPGKLDTPDYTSVEAEFERARGLLHEGDPKLFDHLQLISGTEGMATGPVSDRALTAFLNELGARIRAVKLPGNPLASGTAPAGPGERQQRQVKALQEFTQALLRDSGRVREEFFWSKLNSSSVEQWTNACAAFRTALWQEVIGRLDCPAAASNPRTRQILDRPKWTGYEVVLDAAPNVFAWGDLLLPKDLKPGERRPVVVCQHGLEGVPADVVNDDPASPGFRYYKGFAARLADQGFVVFAPHNPYRGGDRFRQLQRKANPLGLSLFSFIIAQHSRILDWLAQQPFVDASRMGFYGLSYGGKTAMRVPAVLDRYALSICSGDFNDWIGKNVSTGFPGSYMFMNEYEMPEFNLGNTFNYAEMAALIAPRPFMVERGHDDGVGIDEWVASEYAKVRRLYDRLGIGDRTSIEFFNGPHTIHGAGTFTFLRQQLNWPEPP